MLIIIMAKKRLLIFILIILVLALISIYYPILKNTGNTINSYYEKEQATLVRVVDGDTIHALVNGEDVTIRLLGINTPEKKMPHTDDAANFLRQFVNQTIILERDKEDTDKYNRKLRYAYYNDENLDLEILKNGFANAYYYSGLIYEKEILEAENYARENQLGIWEKSKEECAKQNCINLKQLDEQEEFFILINKCSFSCDMSGWFVKDAGRNTFYLSSMNSNEEKTYNSKKEVWNNDHDNLFIFDEQGFLVFYYEY